MLHAAVVPVDWRPIFQFFHIGEFVGIFWIYISQVVPARACPIRHGVRFSFGWTITPWTFRINPFRNSREGRFACFGRLVIFDRRKFYRQVFFRNRHNAAFFAMHDRNRLAPIALSREYPIAQFVLADPLPTSEGGDVFFNFVAFLVVELCRVDKFSFSSKR